ncbi:single-stranded DNA-binding protein [Anaeropeptidivorans aminofermentans]|jgi:single-strand DNA-binding protein|uniref:single-stranded DNA-binding protein n=1 Tax=Anaeropeptidivorans aminofermentans TaxID=2934315 RepID=UPI00202439DA|nr:single-stranded DNA-binding protein [Anaeropeptidivorans aminofermentans]MBE6013318.1 single-stranded DNA-binding protein [Lachnospiraceae bacterium]
MNKVILLGRLTRDPEVRYSQSSPPVAVTRYTIAVNRRFKREGEADADFIPCVAFGKAGEFAERYFKKGMMVCVSGRIQVSSWEDQQGQKRWSTDVIIDEQDFAESKASFASRKDNEPAPKEPAGYQPSAEPEGFSAISESIDDDDLPF